MTSDETEQSINETSSNLVPKEKYYSEIMECIKLNDYEKEIEETKKAIKNNQLDISCGLFIFIAIVVISFIASSYRIIQTSYEKGIMQVVDCFKDLLEIFMSLSLGNIIYSLVFNDYGLFITSTFLVFIMILVKRKNTKIESHLKSQLEISINNFNTQLKYMEYKFENNDFSIHKDRWQYGYELLGYFNNKRAYTFNDAYKYLEEELQKRAATLGLNNAYNTGHEAGYKSGYGTGYSSGYSEGRSSGYSSGYSDGKRARY